MPSLVHLSRLTRRLAEIPYQNVTKILARERGAPAFPVFEGPLSSDAGGTCFARTRHAWEFLSANGFTTYPVMASRTYGPNTHCALIVAVEEKKYLVDPGFLLPVPVPLDGGYLHDRHLRIIERDRVIRSTITSKDIPEMSRLFQIDRVMLQDSFEITWARFQDGIATIF